MKKFIYAIYDLKSESFSDLIVSDNDNVIKRQVIQNLKSDKSPYKNIEEDFQLFRLGIYDFETGEVAPDKKLLFNFKEVLNV